jgi:predicted DNA-binding protein
MAPEAKTEQFLFRLGQTEAKMLQELSDKTGLTRADVIRQLIRREHAQVFAEAPPKRKR